jgi:UDP-N-acetylmuramoylalanine--D-glutamate ligase
VLTGATAGKIHSALLSCSGTAHGQINILLANSFENALILARENARRGGCVLLSPASASFDSFKNFSERGRHFKKLVSELE